MNIIDQMIQEKYEAIEKITYKYEILKTQATSSNTEAMRLDLVKREKAAKKLLMEQDKKANEINDLLVNIEDDSTIPPSIYERIDCAACKVDEELFRRQDLYDTYRKALFLLDELSDTLRYIEAQED